MPVRLDLADPLSVEAAFNAALAEAGYFDVLINNAGAGHFDPAELRSHGNDCEPVSNSGFRPNPIDATRTAPHAGTWRRFDH